MAPTISTLSKHLVAWNCGDGTAPIEWEAVCGYTYYLVIDGYDCDQGPHMATLDCIP